MTPDTPSPEPQPPGSQHSEAPNGAAGRRDGVRDQADASTRSGIPADTLRLVCVVCGTAADAGGPVAGRATRCPGCQAEMIVTAEYDREWDGRVLPIGGAEEAAGRREASPMLGRRRRRRLTWIAATILLGGLLWTWWGGWQRSVDAIVLRTLPRDTDAITSLTGVQAEALMRERGRTSWTSTWTPGLRAYQTGYGPDVLQPFFPRVLAASTMSLDGLRDLPVEVAIALVRQPRGVFVNGLSLDGLTSVPPVDAMRVLREFHGDLSLGGVTELSRDDALKIAEVSARSLSLNGLAAITDQAAAAISKYGGSLHLDGLTTLSDEAAASLSRHKGPSLSLDGLAEISDGLAEALADYPGSLHLDGIVSLSATQARFLRKNNTPPSLRRWRTDTALKLTTLTVEQAELLLAGRRHEESMALSIESLTPDVAEVLAAYPGSSLELGKLATLTAEQARPLVDRKPAELSSRRALALGIESLTPDVADVLATHPGPLHLGKLTDIPVEAEIALTRRDGLLSCRGLTSLKSGQLAEFLDTRSCPRLEDLSDISPEAASVLVKKSGCDLNLSSLVSLSPDLARALGRDNKGHAWYCDLLLDGLKEIDLDAAAAVAAYGDGTLSLNGLGDLSPEVARALARHRGHVSLLGLKTLSADVARALAPHQGGMSLGLETLSDESGKIIAGAEGLLLPHLVEATPGTLAAIKARPGLRMPPALYTPVERFFWYSTGTFLQILLAALAAIAANLVIGVSLTRRLARLGPSILPTARHVKTAFVPTIIATSLLVGVMTFLVLKHLPQQAAVYRRQGVWFAWADYAGFDLLLCGFVAAIALSVAYYFFTLARRSALSRPLVRPLWTMRPYVGQPVIPDALLNALMFPLAGGFAGFQFALSGDLQRAYERLPTGPWSVRLAVTLALVVPWLTVAAILWRAGKRAFMAEQDGPATFRATADGIVRASRWETCVVFPWSEFASYAWKADHLEFKKAWWTRRTGLTMRFVVPPEQQEAAHAFLSARMPGEGSPSVATLLN